nr:PREDICTED: uncharacterized protein LOC103280496 [Anolis carolinensis]|eukprot:XP_008117934.1 PREDICTED: uncharacterized protein LOC103280496 [Anolis carolinensis]
MKVEGQEMTFLVDTGADHSVVTKPVAPKNGQELRVIGATGQRKCYPMLQSRRCDLAKQQVMHEFLYIPECPIPLLGRDLLCKMRAILAFEADGKMEMAVRKGPYTLICPMSEEWRIFTVCQIITEEWKRYRVPDVWAEDNPPGLAWNIPPVQIEVKPGMGPVAIRQYPIPRKAVEGINLHLARLLKYGILRECRSPWNTPLLPVQKPGTQDYRPVQDLRAVNQATVTIHPVVPNPYVLLSLIPAAATHFTVLDLKDAFFCIRIEAESQPIFAFQWEDPTTGTKTQYTWTRLPQGFKNSPTIFGTALAQDLQGFPSDPKRRVLLQYVDDLLLAAISQEECHKATKELLHLLNERGYKVSKNKAQLCKTSIKYLGFRVSQGERQLEVERKQTVCAIPTPTSRRQVREFLGSAGFCRIWIPNFAIMARPLYEATKGGEKEPFKWTPDCDQAFSQLKQALVQAPALGLPDLEKPFTLYVGEQDGIAVGVLTQLLGTWQRPVAYLSKQIDNVAKGWPTCLRAVAATALLVQEADKLTLGQELIVKVPHSVLAIMEYKGHHWFTNSRMLKYQTLLCENPRIKLQVCSTLNPASLLPVEGELLQHDCLETMDEVYSSRPDLKDQPWPKADATLFTDGSSFIENGQRYSGYAVVTATTVWEAEPLPLNTSAQKAELIALIRALELSEGKTVNIYTDSKYAFTILHAHGALYKEKGLLNSAGKQIQHCETILRLLDAVWIPAKVAVMHYRGHQYGEDPVTSGNRYADTTAKAAARKGRGQEPVMAPLQVKDWLQKGDLPYTPEEKQWAQREEAVWKDGWLVLPDQRLFVARQVAWELIKEAHQETHMGKTALASLLGRQLYINGLTALTGIASARCHICAKNNPRTGPLLPPGNQYQGNTPFESLVVDFTEMPRYGPHKYLLVFVCTHSGWPEAYPTRTEKAAEVSKALLRDIIPQIQSVFPPSVASRAAASALLLSDILPVSPAGSGCGLNCPLPLLRSAIPCALPGPVHLRSLEVRINGVLGALRPFSPQSTRRGELKALTRSPNKAVIRWSYQWTRPAAIMAHPEVYF